MSPQAIEKKLAELSRWLPDVERPLAQLSTIVEGKNLLLRQGEGLLEAGGQFRFDFDAARGSSRTQPAQIQQGRRSSDRHRADGRTAGPVARRGGRAGRGRRTASRRRHVPRLAGCRGTAGGGLLPVGGAAVPDGRSAGGAERYYMAIELDEDYVEARANLGCVLAESGQPDLAVAAFEGALAYHREYRTRIIIWLARWTNWAARPRLTSIGRPLGTGGDSPWAALARQRLAAQTESLSR